MFFTFFYFFSLCIMHKSINCIDKKVSIGVPHWWTLRVPRWRAKKRQLSRAYHGPSVSSRRGRPQVVDSQGAQLRDLKFVHFFCIFCLTNCWPCDIIEIRAAGAWAARKKPPMVYPQGLWLMWCRGSESNRHSLLPQQVFYHFELPRHKSGFSSRHGSHIFSALGSLVHICIPHTYRPCGRIMGRGLM